MNERAVQQQAGNPPTWKFTTLSQDPWKSYVMILNQSTLGYRLGRSRPAACAAAHTLKPCVGFGGLGFACALRDGSADRTIMTRLTSLCNISTVGWAVRASSGPHRGSSELCGGLAHTWVCSGSTSATAAPPGLNGSTLNTEP